MWAWSQLRLNFMKEKLWPIVKYRDTMVSCVRTAEPIEVLFGLKTWVGPKNHILEEGRDTPHEGALLRSLHPIGKHCNSELRNNDWLNVYICTTHLASAIYRCSSLGYWHLHLQEISDLKHCFLNTWQTVAFMTSSTRSKLACMALRHRLLADALCSFFAGSGSAYFEPQRWDLYIGPMHQPRKRRGIGRCVWYMCALCRLEEGTVGMSSLSGISMHDHSRHGLLSG